MRNEAVKEQAFRLGFSACGIAKAGPVAKEAADTYRQWTANGHHASMGYLADNVEKRLDPTLLLPGARSVIVVAMNYAPAQRLPDNEYQIADYALGRDYHDLLKERLRQLAALIPAIAENDYKVCVDTVPILERYWAIQAGLGFQGRNHLLIIPGAGSQFFLGEIVTTLEADHYDPPFGGHRCGTCRQCVDACPSGALTNEDDVFHAGRCLSYQTIENRAPQLAAEVGNEMGDTIYGCDRCQRVCPWNRFAKPTDEPHLQPNEDLLKMTKEDWQQLSIDTYRQLFRGSAVKRAKYEGLMRNIHAVANHQD